MTNSLLRTPLRSTPYKTYRTVVVLFADGDDKVFKQTNLVVLCLFGPKQVVTVDERVQRPVQTCPVMQFESAMLHAC